MKTIRPIAHQETVKMSNESQSNVHIIMYLYTYMLWVFLSQTRKNTRKKPISRAIFMPNIELFININLESDVLTFSHFQRSDCCPQCTIHIIYHMFYFETIDSQMNRQAMYKSICQP